MKAVEVSTLGTRSTIFHENSNQGCKLFIRLKTWNFLNFVKLPTFTTWSKDTISFWRKGFKGIAISSSKADQLDVHEPEATQFLVGWSHES